MIYDNSKLQTFKDCPEKYRLKNLVGLKKREEGLEEHDKNFGKAIHTGLELHYKGKSITEIKEAFSKDYMVQLNPDDMAKTQENGLVLIDAYIKHYEQEDKNWKIRAVEVADTFEIAKGISFMVKIDLVVEQQGCIYFVDHKTTGKAFNWTYWGQFEPNSQLTAYTAYCQSKYGECSGGIINGLQLGYRKNKYMGEPAGFHYSFQRQLFNRNKEQVEAWKHDAMGWVANIDAHTQAYETGLVKVLPKNEGQCRFCSFKEICISCADEQIIEQLYEVTNPNEYLEQAKESVE
jgi:CRISPR/Cas system-associated exonuclease Cas4 (RecB family)